MAIVRKTADDIIAADAGNRFINRELSWLAFNERVMEEADNQKHPILERLRFLSISANNLDEFYMVRVAGLKGQVNAAVNTPSQDGMTPSQQLAAIAHAAGALMAEQQRCWTSLRAELEQAGLSVVEPEQLTDEDRHWLSGWFGDHILPALTPMAIDPAQPFPFFPNSGLVMALRMARLSDGTQINTLVHLPQQLGRFVRLPGDAVRFIALERVVSLYANLMFPELDVAGKGLFRVVRDSEMHIDEEAEDLVRTFESALQRRRRGNVIRLEVESGMPNDLRDFVAGELKVEPVDVISMEGMPGLVDAEQLINGERPELEFNPFIARFPERIREFDGDCFAAIRAKDFLVHHPYESFDVVVQFLRQAARDQSVVEIKQTLYRTSDDSPIVEALIKAAKAGKSVTAFVELKARFDEEANIRWARDLERAGAHVVYSSVDLKVHAKVSLISRREDNDLNTYVHFGTGNYHPITARTYTDLSYFTCDAAIGRDAARLFNYMTGIASPEKMEKLIFAPHNLRETLLELIAGEVEHADAGRPAQIWAKLNALVDLEIVESLYAASRAGVKIDLIVRGICCLRAGVPGLSDNIRVKSVVGRYLEHGRIVCVGDGHCLPSTEAKVFVSSADWMPRNLNGRVEVLVPIENKTVKRQIVEQIMVATMSDTAQSWDMIPDGTFRRTVDSEEQFSAHTFFMTNPSLSGRGSALQPSQLPPPQPAKSPKAGRWHVSMTGPQYSKLPVSAVRQAAPVAVIDIGSNSVRLVVYETAGRAPIPVFNERALCGLGRDLGRSGRLPDTAIEHAHATLERFASLCDAMGVKKIYAIATAAIREAEDGAAFVSEAGRRSGLKIRVLNGVEEARISASGVVSAFPAADGVMADLGGGSVEIVELEEGRIRAHETFPLGPLRLHGKQKAGSFDDTPTIVDGIRKINWLGQARDKKFYAVGGAWRSLAQIHMMQQDYPLRVVHGYSIPATTAREFMAMIAGLSQQTLERIPGIDRRRIDVLPYAAHLLTHLLAASKANEIVFSAFGVREGCIFEQLNAGGQRQDPLIEACRNIAARDGRTTNDGMAVFHWMSPLFSEESDEERRLREAASLLADIAWSEHPIYRVEHAFLRVLRLPIVGIDHAGRASVALAVAARHAAVDRQLVDQHTHGMLDEAAVMRARTIGLALRLGYTMCGGVTSVLKELEFRNDGNDLTLVLPQRHAKLAGEVVMRRFESLSKLMGRKAKLDRGGDVPG